MIPMCPHGMFWHWFVDIGTVFAMVGTMGTLIFAFFKVKFSGMFWRKKSRSTMTDDEISRVLEKRT